MWVYHKFAKQYGWDPRQVDELRQDEEEWLPVLYEAEAIAAEQLSDN